MDALTELIRNDMKPALGVTEPGAIAFAVSTAREHTSGDIRRIELSLNSGMYKNAFTCGIPGSPEVGNYHAAALGAAGADPSKGLECLEGITPEQAEAALKMVESGIIEVTMKEITSRIFIEAKVITDEGDAAVTITDSHTNIVRITENGKTVFGSGAAGGAVTDAASGSGAGSGAAGIPGAGASAGAGPLSPASAGSRGYRSGKRAVEEEDFLIPITATSDVVLDDLIGYEIQKERLIANTEAFVSGRAANNVLLYGDAGTGKSTSIKAILNQYYDRGLRMIEVYKHEFRYLQRILAEVKNRNYRFIIYMDDLSFEDFEIEYKYLKAVIEGGLETKPENVLIYATSNRRHLIKETWKDRADRDDELHRSDTMQEKLSLVARFGISIGYMKPSHKEYLNIVSELARRYPQITLTEEELLQKANQWELRSGGASGRTAQQFINYLAGASE